MNHCIFIGRLTHEPELQMKDKADSQYLLVPVPDRGEPGIFPERGSRFFHLPSIWRESEVFNVLCQERQPCRSLWPDADPAV